MTPEQLFLSQLPFIKRVSDSVCRRHHCTREEADEFASVVQEKLIADDYAVFRKFEGKSRLETYLTTVITRLYFDWRNHLWGKWRPSAEAKRLGPVAVKLEELARDGYTFEESCETLRTNLGVVLSRAELADLAAKLPPRTPRRMEGEGSWEEVPAGEPGPDERILEEERGAGRQRVWEALGRAWGKLPDEDRLILKLLFQQGMQAVEVARALHLEQKPLYRRIERLKKSLREELEREGVGRELVAEALGSGK
jgi:RNA polymerase sigma factor for flagellar operon FliA